MAGPARASCAMVRLLTRPHGTALEAELRRAVTGEVALDYALAALDALAPVDRQRVLASYAGLSAKRPATGCLRRPRRLQEAQRLHGGRLRHWTWREEG